jgi:glycosyltransferase involved in cell wall biosynthesis
MKPLVSVIIPNYNYAKYLREAVDSVLSQTYQHIEIIVVDDGSKDKSREIIESYGEKIKSILQKNQGVSAARNNGVAESKGEYIAFLDADDAWLPAKIEMEMEMFVADPEIGMVHVSIVEMGDAGNRLLERMDGMAGWISEEFLRFERPVVLGGGSGILVRRNAFDEVGGFDTRLSTSADWDFFYQVSSRFKVAFVPEILLKYRIHGSNMHGNIKVMEHDMMLGYEKAFANGAKANRRQCYGNLHKVLAGSYFRSGQYLEFVRHAMISIFKTPSNFGYFVGFPIRQLRKRNARK